MADIAKIVEKNREIAVKIDEINKLKLDRYSRQEIDFNFMLSPEYEALRSKENKMQNELQALKLEKTMLFHEYRFNIKGNLINTDGTTTLTTRAHTILSTLDCQLGNIPCTLNITIPIQTGLLREIQKEWSTYFDGHFTVVNIIQIR